MHDRGGCRVPVRRWLTLASSFLESLCCSGLVFGWASLVFVLKKDGYFADHCVNVTLNDNATTTTTTTGRTTDCRGQDQQLSMVLSIAAFTTNILRFPFGYVFDRFGTTVTRLITTTLYTSGTILIALSTPEDSVVLFPALCCLMISGMLFCITTAQVGNLFESHRSTVINLNSGFTDSSAGVLLIVKVLHEHGVSLRTTFLVLSCGCIWHLLSIFFLMPRGHIPYPLPADYTYGLNCPFQGYGNRREVKEGGNEEECKKKLKYETDKEVTEEVPSFRSCVLSLFFLWHLLWTAILQFCQFLFLATCNPTLYRLTGNDVDLVSWYTNVLAYIQLCAVLCAPCNGLILDRHKHRHREQGESTQATRLSTFSLSLGLTSLQGLFFCACLTVPILPLQYVTFVLQVSNSVSLYGVHQSYISHAYGLLFSSFVCVSAYVGMTTMSLLTFVHPLHIHLYCRRRLGRPHTRTKG
ncbi:hypothetical protein CRUP_001118, partial [Coryphaenoides rupestris]